MKAVKSSEPLREAFPVMKIDYQHRLVKSNTTALPLLNAWGCREGGKIPHQLIGQYPELKASFKNNAPTQCVMHFQDLRITFDVVPFPEAGYVGLYGFHVEATAPESVPQNLRMAG